MNKLYLFLVMSVIGDAPSRDVMTKDSGEYIFMPLGGDRVFTVDESVWNAVGSKAEQVLIPSTGQGNIILQDKIRQGMTVFFGLVPEHEIEIPGRGMTELELYESPSNYRVIDAGYDVIDSFGVSAISNIGYTQDEVETLKGLEIAINQYGLISSHDAGVRFAEFADQYAEEHAGFFPVYIQIIKP